MNECHLKSDHFELKIVFQAACLRVLLVSGKHTTKSLRLECILGDLYTSPKTKVKKGPQKERIVFQPSFFMGYCMLNFVGGRSPPKSPFTTFDPQSFWGSGMNNSFSKHELLIHELLVSGSVASVNLLKMTWFVIADPTGTVKVWYVQQIPV